MVLNLIHCSQFDFKCVLQDIDINNTQAARRRKTIVNPKFPRSSNTNSVISI